MREDRPSGAEVGHREDILRRHGRRHSTAAVVFNHAVAERLGLGPTDHKCLDLLFERGPMNGSELSALTGLSSGAITGVVERLERARFLQRSEDPHDRRKQVLSPNPERVEEVDAVIAPMRDELAQSLEGFDAHQLAAIAEFLQCSTECLLQHAAVLRANARVPTAAAPSGASSGVESPVAQEEVTS